MIVSPFHENTYGILREWDAHACVCPRFGEAAPPESIESPWQTRVGITSQILFRLQLAANVGRPRVTIVDETHVMPDEAVVLDRHPFADEQVRSDLAAGPHLGALQNLDEGPDLASVADGAAVEVDEVANDDISTDANVRRDPLEHS
jgi:hypothetical protein